MKVKVTIPKSEDTEDQSVILELKEMVMMLSNPVDHPNQGLASLLKFELRDLRFYPIFPQTILSEEQMIEECKKLGLEWEEYLTMAIENIREMVNEHTDEIDPKKDFPGMSIPGDL